MVGGGMGRAGLRGEFCSGAVPLGGEERRGGTATEIDRDLIG